MMGSTFDALVSKLTVSPISRQCARIAFCRTSATDNLIDREKETIERADFSTLKWKFNGVDVNEKIHNLLTAL